MTAFIKAVCCELKLRGNGKSSLCLERQPKDQLGAAYTSELIPKTIWIYKMLLVLPLFLLAPQEEKREDLFKNRFTFRLGADRRSRRYWRVGTESQLRDDGCPGGLVNHGVFETKI